MTLLSKLTFALTTSTVAVLAVPTAVAFGAPSTNGPAVCSLRSYPGQPVKHTQDLELKPNYNSFPPTTGTHYYRPAKFNFYTFELPQLAIVHNLEHGGIAVQYGRNVPASTVAEIKAWYLRDTNAMLVAPFAALGNKIALTAWNAPPYQGSTPDPGRGYVATCTDFDAVEFTEFVKAHRYKSGERFPKSLLRRQT
jgi:Protein of unknown function (DUF3105)